MTVNLVGFIGIVSIIAVAISEISSIAKAQKNRNELSGLGSDQVEEQATTSEEFVDEVREKREYANIY